MGCNHSCKSGYLDCVQGSRGRFVSECTVYRLLKEAGLIKAPRVKGFAAGKEYHTKTTRRNQLWQTDAGYFFVVGWGYYYLISALDDYSRMIPGWKVQRSMRGGNIIELVQRAVEFTGQPTSPVGPLDCHHWDLSFATAQWEALQEMVGTCDTKPSITTIP